MSCLLYKHTNDDDFPKISDHFPKISKDFLKLLRRQDERFRTFSRDFRKLSKISEDNRRFPRRDPMMFRSYSKTSEYFLIKTLYVAIAMVILRLVKKKKILRVK